MGTTAIDAALRAHLAGDLRAALDAYAALLAATPDHPDALRLMARLAQRLGHAALAETLTQQIAALPPPSPATALREGMVCLAQGQREAARACLSAAAVGDPTLPDVHHGLGLLAAGDGRLEDAAQAFTRAIALLPGHAQAWANLGAVRRRQGHLAEAITALRRAVTLAPALVEARYGLGQALMQAGEDSPEPFALYEARWLQAGATNLPAMQDRPAWDGHIDPGRRLLLYPEQGLGDMVLAARYAARLAAAGQPLVVEVPGPLVSMLARALPGVTVIARGSPRPPHDLQAPLMSVPARTGWSLSVAAAQPLAITPLPERVALWRQRLRPDGRPLIGLVWQGDITSPAGADRSMPMADLLPLARPGVRLLSLQRGPAAAEAAAWNAAVPLECPDNGALHPDALEDSLAMMSLCDAVVSVDTMAAHLAGSLGRSGVVLLRHFPGWVWADDGRGHALWYPSLRLVGQPAPGDWAGAVAAIGALP